MAECKLASSWPKITMPLTKPSSWLKTSVTLTITEHHRKFFFLTMLHICSYSNNSSSALVQAQLLKGLLRYSAACRNAERQDNETVPASPVPLFRRPGARDIQSLQKHCIFHLRPNKIRSMSRSSGYIRIRFIELEAWDYLHVITSSFRVQRTQTCLPSGGATPCVAARCTSTKHCQLERKAYAVEPWRSRSRRKAKKKAKHIASSSLALHQKFRTENPARGSTLQGGGIQPARKARGSWALCRPF